MSARTAKWGDGADCGYAGGDDDAADDGDDRIALDVGDAFDRGADQEHDFGHECEARE